MPNCKQRLLYWFFVSYTYFFVIINREKNIFQKNDQNDFHFTLISVSGIRY